MLDQEEYKAFYLPQNYAFMSEGEIDRVMSIVDKDKDGSVSMDEFVITGKSNLKQEGSGLYIQPFRDCSYIT